ncbi:MAG: ferritin-like domain-containing protein [Acidobacteriota bacterium]
MRAGVPEVEDLLDRILARSYALYRAALLVHEDPGGRRTFALRCPIETLSLNLVGAIDEISDRVRTRGWTAPRTLEAIQREQRSRRQRPPGRTAEMLEHLAREHQALVRAIGLGLEAAERAGDESTFVLLARRQAIHRETARRLEGRRAGDVWRELAAGVPEDRRDLPCPRFIVPFGPPRRCPRDAPL